MKALLIPADQARKVEVIEISGRDDLRQHVGGIPEPTRYDHEALIFCSDTGRIDGKPMNSRVTDYIRHESDAAWQRGGLLTEDSTYGIYGDAVVIGNGGLGGMRDVPEYLVERFTTGVSRRIDERGKQKRERNEDGMIRIPWRRDPKGPYVVEVTEPGGEPQYLSAAGLDGDGPMVDKISEAVFFERKGDAKHFAFLATEHLEHAAGENRIPPVGSKITILTEREALVQQQVPGCELYEESKIQPVIEDDLRNVVSLASDIEDRSPEEQASLDRINRHLDRPSFDRTEGNGYER